MPKKLVSQLSVMMSVIVKNATFSGNQVRHIIRDEDYWFHLGDVCKCIDIQNPWKIAANLRKLDDGAGISKRYVRNSRGETRKSNFILEEYLYLYVIPRSKKPEARQFTKWAMKVLKTAVRQQVAPVPSLETQMKLLQFGQAHFKDDARIQSLVKEKYASLLGGQPLIEGPKQLTVSEIIEQIGKYSMKFILKNRISIGREICKIYKMKYGAPKTTKKLCNGHQTDVNIYTVTDEITEWVKNACKRRE